MKAIRCFRCTAVLWDTHTQKSNKQQKMDLDLKFDDRQTGLCRAISNTSDS